MNEVEKNNEKYEPTNNAKITKKKQSPNQTYSIDTTSNLRWQR